MFTYRYLMICLSSSNSCRTKSTTYNLTLIDIFIEEIDVVLLMVLGNSPLLFILIRGGIVSPLSSIKLEEALTLVVQLEKSQRCDVSS
jgi:hypothetical protein